jgi:hypothetical protein
MNSIPTVPHAASTTKEATDHFPAVAGSPLPATQAATIELAARGEIKPPAGIIGKLKSALGLEQDARAAAEKAAKARREAEALQAHWESELVYPYEVLAAGVAHAAETIAKVETRLARAEADLRANIGNRHNGEIAIGNAATIASCRAALPILRDASHGVQKQLAAHVEKMRTWGKANGVPKEILDSLTS